MLVGRDVILHPADNGFGYMQGYPINGFIKNDGLTLTSCVLRAGPHELCSQGRQLDRNLHRLRPLGFEKPNASG